MVQAARPRPAREVSVRCADPDEARVIGTRVYHPHDVAIRGDASAFAMTLEATALGPLTVGWLRYDTEVRLDAPAFETAYQVNLISGGVMEARCGAERILATADVAMVYRPDRPTGFTGWRTPAPLLGLKIPRRVLEHELERLLDRPIAGPIDFALGLDVARGPGAEWRALLQAMAGGLGDERALVRQPLVTAPLVHTILTGLLLSARHRYRDELAAPSASAGPGAVRRARAFIDANADRPLTVADVAAEAGVGVRALQQAFRRALGLSPTEYLRQVRLRAAHRELLDADPATTTVADVAARWGWLHAGRFAAHYRDRYGVAPAATLRRGR
ncbi:MAG TPA: helix-turn-helix domain-containing protein [Capillimicrobium sp.]|nr:helix-turn-helix domain-containing protein [Capillimicrobium sp.]